MGCGRPEADTASDIAPASACANSSIGLKIRPATSKAEFVASTTPTASSVALSDAKLRPSLQPELLDEPTQCRMEKPYCDTLWSVPLQDADDFSAAFG
jgi:hypothetical protein